MARGVCYAFNSRDGCEMAGWQCRFAHICGVPGCGAKHARWEHRGGGERDEGRGGEGRERFEDREGRERGASEARAIAGAAASKEAKTTGEAVASAETAKSVGAEGRGVVSETVVASGGANRSQGVEGARETGKGWEVALRSKGEGSGEPAGRPAGCPEGESKVVIVHFGWACRSCFR